MIPITDASVQLDVAEVPDAAAEWLTDQEYTEEAASIWNFQKWLRAKHSDLSPGHRLDLVKAAYAILIEGRDYEDVPSGKAAMQKLRSFADYRKNSEGDSQ